MKYISNIEAIDIHREDRHQPKGYEFQNVGRGLHVPEKVFLQI